MTNRYILLIIGVLSASMFSGCGKYDDGPALSLRTKKARLTNTWRFDKVLDASGGTITSQYDDIVIEFRRNGEYQEEHPTITVTGTWKFVEDKEQIRITYDQSGNAGELTIRRLTGDEFWYENGDYEFHCEPKK